MIRETRPYHLQRFGVRRFQAFAAVQRFANHAELLAIESQGAVAVDRARRFTDTADIVIPMSYELNLL